MDNRKIYVQHSDPRIELVHLQTSAASFATWPQLHPIAFISRPTVFLHSYFDRPLLLSPAVVQRMATLGMDVCGILLTRPIHLNLLFFTSNEMGSIPVRSWSSAFDIFLWQKDVQNSSKALVLEYYQHVAHICLLSLPKTAAYSSTLSTLVLKMRIFVFLLIIFVFQMFFSAANAPLSSLILVLISASVFPSLVTLPPRYVNSVTSSMSCSRLTGSAV